MHILAVLINVELYDLELNLVMHKPTAQLVLKLVIWWP